MPKEKSVSFRKEPEKSKSLESGIWDVPCPIRGVKDAPKYKNYIISLIFTKRLCDFFDDVLNRICVEVASRTTALESLIRPKSPNSYRPDIHI